VYTLLLRLSSVLSAHYGCRIVLLRALASRVPSYFGSVALFLSGSLRARVRWVRLLVALTAMHEALLANCGLRKLQSPERTNDSRVLLRYACQKTWQSGSSSSSSSSSSSTNRFHISLRSTCPVRRADCAELLLIIRQINQKGISYWQCQLRAMCVAQKAMTY
jgi:hypothetical protein